MALKITEDCINCGACEPECPNHAIYEAGMGWAIADGTSVTLNYVLRDGSIVGPNQRFAPISTERYYVVPHKCTECQGFHEEPQCASVCPVDCCVPDENFTETTAELLAKKDLLHV